MNPLYYVSIIGGAALFLAPFIFFSIALLHPKFEKKRSEFDLYGPSENPTPYISSFGIKRERERALLRLDVSKAITFKTIVFDKKGKPCKVIRVSCLDTTNPCWLTLPKDASGVAFVEPNPAKKVSFDMELWKIIVFPLIYAACIGFGLFLIGYGACGVKFTLNPTPNFFYPTKLSYIMAIGTGVIAYLIAFLSLLFHYANFRKKEGK